ncbi:hypothetical protein K466DRAFT_85109 [Polyporus arcularius HHB13444]|uniref:HNH nuclease domain-containing protein n=1 Tax=Polyporus arcularius HHB13444 TaxID=1314778 RepID=A0A5C3PIV4_9APHY|nr:hypothetical protein K466DRAFT_85109 [Polyporus arcularius HHB13444]
MCRDRTRSHRRWRSPCLCSLWTFGRCACGLHVSRHTQASSFEQPRPGDNCRTVTPRPDRIMVPNLGGVMKPELLARDAYTCLKTGQIDLSAPPAMSGEREDLQCARICHMPLTEYHKEWLPETSQWVADFYEHYLGVDISAIPMLRAENYLLLSPQSCELFYQWIWTLKPTEIPNRYQVIDSRRENDGDGGARDGDFVTFENHDPKGSQHILEPAELPSRDALLVHAAYTSVRHLSGFMDESKDFLDDPNFSFLGRTGERRTYVKECEAYSYTETEEDSLEYLEKVTDDSDGETSTASRRGGRLRRAAHTLKGLFICG